MSYTDDAQERSKEIRALSPKGGTPVTKEDTMNRRWQSSVQSLQFTSLMFTAALRPEDPILEW